MDQDDFTPIDAYRLDIALWDAMFLKDYLIELNKFDKILDKLNYINSNAKLQRACRLDYERNRGH